MEIKQDTLEKMLNVSYRNIYSNSDKIRASLKGDYYAQKIIEIRSMSKFKLTKFISDTKSKKGVKLGYRIARVSSSKIYRKLDSEIQQDIELINYARNRLYAKI
tara:strand:+ start:11971 stop:12282 length:312 start_codon:yes stop_codon:yes gene_type:complete